MFKVLDGLIDRIFAALGALVFAQVPSFFNAYNQRLGGHLSELQLQIASMQKAAQISGKGLQEYIQKFVAYNDVDVASQGGIMNGMLERFSQLTDAHQSLIHASPFTRPFFFVRHLQFDIAQKTLDDFQISLSFTLESGIYALIGMGAGYFLYTALKKMILKIGAASLRLRVNFSNAPK